MDGITSATQPEAKSLLMMAGFIAGQRIKIHAKLKAIFFAQSADGAVKSEVKIRFEVLDAPRSTGENLGVPMILEPLLYGLARLSHVQRFGGESRSGIE